MGPAKEGGSMPAVGEVDGGEIVGTEGDDVLTGTGAADLIFPLEGADTAKGRVVATAS
jgi:RTX calcium-binding nonapeptide repeat (4 copies)